MKNRVSSLFTLRLFFFLILIFSFGVCTSNFVLVRAESLEAETNSNVIIGIDSCLSDTANEMPITVEDFDCILQMPELPTGCEITALTMVLNYYGFHVSKETMAADYLPTILDYEIPGGRGRRSRQVSYGPDLESYFLGDPFTEYGTVCGPTAIVCAANSYLSSVNSSLEAVDLSGITFDKLYERVLNGQPVVVWTTISLEDRTETMGWYTEYGTYVEWSHNDHGTVLIGCSDDKIVLADPLDGIVMHDREQFESVFAQRGFKCVVIE